MEFFDYDLPEFCFLKRSEHEKQPSLYQQTIVQHTPSLSIFEVIAMDKIPGLKVTENVKEFDFIYHNVLGVKLNYKMLVYFTTVRGDDLNKVFINTAKWFVDHLTKKDEKDLLS